MALLVVCGLLITAAGLASYHQYRTGLQPVSSSQQTVLFTVDAGNSVKEIASNLAAKQLIRSAWAMELYVRLHHLGAQLQAGTYALSPHLGTRDIVTTISKGKISTNLVTILPGKRIDQIRADLINDGFAPNAVDQALDPAQYADLPVMAYKPGNVTTLEGLLWPDSYQIDTTTSVATIIRQSLTAMGDHLTADVRAAFAAEKLSPYQGLILTSIITREVSNRTDQPQVAQVFLKRLSIDMMLGSDVTALYGSIVAGQQPNLSYDSPYNTLIHKGLPPTPISTITANALDAATHPANTEWLYFVAGDNGTTYFSTNAQDHEALTQKYCHALCGR